MYVKSTIWLKKYILREIDGIEYLGLTYELDDPNDVYNFAVFLPGPKNSPYEGGTWRIEVTYTADYPFKPPKIIFDTPIYHPNIRSDGTFYLPMIVDNWSIENSLVKILFCLQQLLCNPVMEDGWDPTPDEERRDIAEMYMNDKEAFVETAKEWTADFATDKCTPKYILK